LERDMQTLADAHNPLGMHTLQAERASREAQAKQDREDLELGRRIRELAEKVPGRPVQLCKEHHWSVWVINRGVYSGVSALDAVRLAHKENGGQS
jgi:hypothetical protein